MFKYSTLGCNHKVLNFWSLEACIRHILDLVFALGIPVRLLVHVLWKVLCYNGMTIWINIFNQLSEKLDVTIHPGIFRLESKQLNASNWWVGREIEIKQVGWSTRNMCLDGFIPCCKLSAGGFLGREVNKSCSAYKGLSALMWHSSFHAAVRLPVIHPTLLSMLPDSLEVKERVYDLADLWRLAPMREA